MTEEKFIYIKDLKEKIEGQKRKLRSIEELMGGCGLSCKISGTPVNRFNHTVEYFFMGKDQIKDILKSEREKILNEITELEKTFSEL